MGNHGKILQNSVLILLLGGLSVGVARGQHKSNSSAPKSAPAPHVSAPRPSVSRPSTPPSRSSTTHSSPMGGRPGSSTGLGHGNTGARPGTTLGKTGTRPVGKTGNGTVGTHPTGRTAGTGTVSKNGNVRGPMGRTGNPAMGKGGAGSMSRNVNRPLPGKQVSLRGGGTANLRPNGQIRSINRNGMQINHGLNGSRHIESTHNGARIVTTGKHAGYVQRPYVTRATDRPTSRGPSSSITCLTPTFTALTPTEATAAITATILRITTRPCITAGPTIPGQPRSTMDGDGARRPGTDTTVAISRRIRRILRLRSGLRTT